METKGLSLKVQELAQANKINIDSAPDYFGRTLSDKIAACILANIETDDSLFTNIKRDMGYIDEIRNNEPIVIKFPVRKATGSKNYEIPSDYIGNDARRAIADSIYCKIHKDLLCYIADAELQGYMQQGGKLYENVPLWEKAKRIVNDRISNAKTLDKDLSKKQELAVKSIYELIAKENNRDKWGFHTYALCFIYDILVVGGLITPPEYQLDNRQKRDYLQNHLKKRVLNR